MKKTNRTNAGAFGLRLEYRQTTRRHWRIQVKFGWLDRLKVLLGMKPPETPPTNLPSTR
jgi:hypothetical protein